MIKAPPAQSSRQHLENPIAAYRQFLASGEIRSQADTLEQKLENFENDALAETALNFPLMDPEKSQLLLDQLARDFNADLISYGLEMILTTVGKFYIKQHWADARAQAFCSLPLDGRWWFFLVGCLYCEKHPITDAEAYDKRANQEWQIRLRGGARYRPFNMVALGRDIERRAEDADLASRAWRRRQARRYFDRFIREYRELPQNSMMRFLPSCHLPAEPKQKPGVLIYLRNTHQWLSFGADDSPAVLRAARAFAAASRG